MFVALGRALQLVLLLLMMRVAAGLLPPVEMGRMALINSSTALFALFLIGPVGQFINRRLFAWNETGAVQHYLKRYCGYVLCVCGLTTLLLCALDYAGFGTSHTPLAWLIFLITGSLFFNTLNQTLIPSLNLLGFGVWFVVLTLGTLLTGFVLAMIFVFSGRHEAEFWLTGLLAGQALFALLGWCVFRKKISPPRLGLQAMTHAQIFSLFMFAWPIMAAAGMNWVQTQSYRFVLNGSLGLESLGFFVAGYGLSAGLISGLESMLMTWLHPVFYRNLSEGGNDSAERAWSEYAGAILPSILLFTCLIVALAPEVTRILLGPRYVASANYAIWGALAEAMRVVASVYAMAAHARMKTSLLLWPNALGAVLAVLLVFLLVPTLGGVGAGVALSVTGAILVLVWHRRIRREMAIALPGRQLLVALAMGASLVSVAAAMHYLPMLPTSLLDALLRATLLVPLYLFMQYHLLPLTLRARKSVSP
ncbi:MAG: hypothetical protein JWL63_493 [Rhodocyclales bacterium]|nr:hypothetical protein [Rhodocyclales bacterium]